MNHGQVTALDVMGAAHPEPPRCAKCHTILAGREVFVGLCLIHEATYGDVETARMCDWMNRSGIHLEWHWTPEKGHYAEIPDDIMARWEEERAWQEEQREVEPCPW